MNREWNNARLNQNNEYVDFVPVFRALYQSCGQKLDCFYKKAERLGNMKPALRKREMKRMLDDEV
jgi:predicted aminopeptidase